MQYSTVQYSAVQYSTVQYSTSQPTRDHLTTDLKIIALKKPRLTSHAFNTWVFLLLHDFQIFFDDNIERDRAHIVDVRNGATFDPVPFR